MECGSWYCMESIVVSLSDNLLVVFGNFVLSDKSSQGVRQAYTHNLKYNLIRF